MKGHMFVLNELIMGGLVRTCAVHVAKERRCFVNTLATSKSCKMQVIPSTVNLLHCINAQLHSDFKYKINMNMRKLGFFVFSGDILNDIYTIDVFKLCNVY